MNENSPNAFKVSIATCMYCLRRLRFKKLASKNKLVSEIYKKTLDIVVVITCECLVSLLKCSMMYAANTAIELIEGLYIYGYLSPWVILQ